MIVMLGRGGFTYGCGRSFDCSMAVIAKNRKTCSILPSGAGFFEAFLISEIRKIPLTLAELGCSTSLLQSVLLSFLHTRVSCQEAGCLQGRTVLVIVNLAECS